MSTPGESAFAPQVELDPVGNATAVWSRGNVVRAATRSPGGIWQPAQDLTSATSARDPRIAVDQAGNAVTVWEQYDGANSIIWAASRSAGSWQPGQAISAAGANAADPAIDVDAAGNAVALWYLWNGSAYVAQAAIRPAGGNWQAAQTISGANLGYDPQVALDPSGTAIAVWHRFDGANTIVEAAIRPPGGPWQAPQALSLPGADAAFPQVAVDAAGNAVVVWRRSNGTNDIVQAAVRLAGGPWQLPAQDLSAPGQHAGDPQVAVDPAGNATAGWWRSDGAHAIVQAADRPAGGPWQLPAVDLSAAGEGSAELDVARDPAGTAVAVWHRWNGTHWVVQGAVRTSAGTWQLPAKDVSQTGGSAHRPQTALDSAGNGVVVWVREGVAQAALFDATAPVVRAVNGPSRGFARQRLTFSVDAFDGWSALAPPVWNFGDGKSASGRTVTHTFARGGTYTVGVTQADAVGNASSAQRLLTLRVARCFGKAATIVGSSGPDRIVGTRRADVIVTLAGADRVRGRGGNDRICGGKGRDRLAGGAGNDRINGGPGKDICSQGKGRGRLVAC